MNITRWIAVSLVLGGTVFGLYSYKSSLQQAAAAQGANMPEPSATITAIEVTAFNYQKTIKVSGEVQAYKYLVVNNELAGKIIRLNAIAGSKVEKGQILLELDHSDEDARLIAAQARLTLKKQTLNRYVKLKKNNEISAELVDQANAELQIAKSDIAVLTAAISKKRLVAPFTAKVGIHTLEVGQYLDNNSQVLELVGISDFTWVDFYLPQVYKELKLGATVSLSPMNQERVLAAEIIAIDPQLSSASRNLKYRAQIASTALSLKPNTLISVIAPIAETSSLVVVPDLSIKRDPFGSYVFLLEAEEEGAYRAKQVKVELGDRQADQVMVLNGLTVGQLIANQGAFKLFSGMKVYIANASDVEDSAKL
ncbi:efflux transporter periplasmic adaptor subunit [Thalassotalea sp. 42_200_T64]|nr:efflux transporter periplasmic adaptor subunit [Thalassotalea sp. 42_200_T64]